MRIGLVVPHIFMHRQILPHVIFSPGQLALTLADGLQGLGAQVTLFTPGPVDTNATNVTADLTYFEQELAARGDTYTDLLKKHPLTFITLARQVQSELIAKAYSLANDNQLDIVHIYTNEEDIALPFAALCNKPVVFTHHDPFNFLVKYKNVFPKYSSVPWLSVSYAQRTGMPPKTNWVANIYHGIEGNLLQPVKNPSSDYVVYIGRIIQQKGVHLAIEAAKRAGVPLKIAGRHYAGKKDAYWREYIEPRLGDGVEYLGFIKDSHQKRQLLGNARALIMPSLFDEPFGMVAIESLACGTPVVGLNSGAIPEVVKDKLTGFIVANAQNEASTVASIAQAIKNVTSLDRNTCRRDFEQRFTAQRMCQEHLSAYKTLTTTLPEAL
ncbi:MAG TPA: glycosyltransferase [Candidatus Saccharimonadales bacterium]|nr:glycosyltransferase [Candidatus Saccharimonadales bacterium]